MTMHASTRHGGTRQSGSGRNGARHAVRALATGDVCIAQRSIPAYALVLARAELRGRRDRRPAMMIGAGTGVGGRAP
jgi:hypothetical protein